MRIWLKEMRNKKQYSQERIANTLCISLSYYNLIENGERKKKLDIELARKLSKVFDVSIEWIIEQETKQNKATTEKNYNRKVV